MTADDWEVQFGPSAMELTKLSHMFLVSALARLTQLTHYGSHFADNTFKWIFLNENVQILIKISWSLFLVFLGGGNYKYFSIVSGNGLAPTRRQAIIWNNDRLFTDD